METLKGFFSNTKKTAILGMIGSILLFIINYISLRPLNILNRIVLILPYFSLVIYFIIIVMRMYFKKGNVKVANFNLIFFFSVSILYNILIKVLYKYTYVSFEVIPNIITIILNIILLLYFRGILLRKKSVINNKMFAIILILYCLYGFIGNILLFQIIITIGYLAIIPYFYNYYNLVKGGNNNGK